MGPRALHDLKCARGIQQLTGRSSTILLYISLFSFLLCLSSPTAPPCTQHHFCCFCQPPLFVCARLSTIRALSIVSISCLPSPLSVVANLVQLSTVGACHPHFLLSFSLVSSSACLTSVEQRQRSLFPSGHLLIHWLTYLIGSLFPLVQWSPIFCRHVCSHGRS